MKIYLTLFTLLGLVALTGCSADDLTGPDAAGPVAAQTVSPESAPAARADHSLSAPDVLSFSVTGAWRASDEAGTITLFIDELGPPPESSPSAGGPLGGKGIVSDLISEPLAVSVEGKYQVRDIAFTLSKENSGAIAKAEGKLSRDFRSMKVILIDGEGNSRPLTFERL